MNISCKVCKIFLIIPTLLSGPTIRATRLAGTSLQNLCEIRAASAEKAGYYLDAALSNRSVDAQVIDGGKIFISFEKIFQTDGNKYFRVETLTLSSRYICTNIQ